MNKKDNRLFSFIVLAISILLASLFGYFANATTFDTQTMTIGIVIPDSTQSIWDNFKIGLRANAKEHSITLDFANTTSSMSQDDYDDALEDFFNNGIEGLVLYYPYEVIESKILPKLMKKIPVVFIENPIEVKDASYGSVMIDDYTAGKTLALQIIRNTSKPEKVGIAYQQRNLLQTKKRLEGVLDVLHTNAYPIAWETTDLTSESFTRYEQNQSANIWISLDNFATEAFIDYSVSINASAKIFGFGGTNKTIYNTDIGVVTSLLVTNGYDEGYKSLDQIYAANTSKAKLHQEKLDYSIFTNANLFTSKNQKLLFPMNP